MYDELPYFPNDDAGTAAAGTTRQVPAAGGSAGGQPVLCVVSDDHGFEDMLKLFKQRGWRAIVMSCTSFKNADVRIDWDNVVG